MRDSQKKLEHAQTDNSNMDTSQELRKQIINMPCRQPHHEANLDKQLRPNSLRKLDGNYFENIVFIPETATLVVLAALDTSDDKTRLLKYVLHNRVWMFLKCTPRLVFLNWTSTVLSRIDSVPKSNFWNKGLYNDRFLKDD